MTSQESLLVVQDHDTTIDQLRHRKHAMPERARLVELEKQRSAIEATRAEVVARRDEIATRQAAAETEIASSEKRIEEINARMLSGQVSASRDLQRMSGEVDHIKERVSHLEDTALEAMDERAPLDDEVARHDDALAAIATEAAELRAAVAAAESDIDAEVERELQARADAADGVPPDLLDTYEKLRTRLGGIGAARLDGNRCTGCHLTLPATELDRLRREPADSLVFCESCGRVLVRTS